MDGWRVPSTTLFPTGPPQLNHVALSLRPELLSGEGRRDIARFFRKVFGWRPIVMKSVDPGYLVLSTNRADQFIFLCPQPAPMVAHRMDHFGVSVGTLDELHGVRDRAASYREGDPRVELIDPTVEDHAALRIHNIYVGYLLPLMIEVQYWEFPQPDAVRGEDLHA